MTTTTAPSTSWMGSNAVTDTGSGMAAAMAAGPGVTVNRVVEILASDHSTSMAKGAIRSVTMRPGAPGWLRGLYDTPSRTPPKRTPYRSPLDGAVSPEAMAARATGRPAPKRDLTQGEAVWIASLPTDPHQLSDEDVKALGQIAGEVQSPGDKRLVASRLEGAKALTEARRRLDAAEWELATLSQPQDPTRLPCWNDARRWLGEQIRREIPELAQPEAETRATRLVQEAWKPNTGRRNDLRAEIGELCRTHGIDGFLFDGTKTWGVNGDDNRADLRPDVAEGVTP